MDDSSNFKNFNIYEIVVHGFVKLRVFAGKLCVVCAVLVRFVHSLVLGAWLLSFSFKHIWRSLNRAVC